MKFGIFGGATAQNNKQISDSQNYTDFIDYVVEAEALGFDSTFLVEHHFTGMDQVSASINLLTYLAAKTKTMRLGTGVVVLPWHNPVLLAEQAKTLDLLSRGRFDFGIGRGYRDYEFSGFCVPMEEAEERYQECVEILKKSMTGERFTHHGKRWHYDNIVVEPSCVQKPHPPFWVGAHSEKSIREAADNDISLLLDQTSNAAVIGEKVAWYKDQLARKGKSYKPHSIAVTRAFHLAHTPEERKACHDARASFLLGINQAGTRSRGVKIERTYDSVVAGTEDHALIGPPDEIVKRLQDLENVGVDYILMMDVQWSFKSLRTFSKEIMPKFKAAPAKAAAE